MANRAVLAAYSDEASPATRCATLESWAALPFWQPYYRTALIDGMNSAYLHFHGEPFCDAVGDAFAPKDRAVRPIAEADPCAAYGPRTQAAGFATRLVTGLYVPEINTGTRAEPPKD